MNISRRIVGIVGSATLGAVALIGAVAPAAQAAACPSPTTTFDLATGYTVVVFDQAPTGTACTWDVPTATPNITALQVIAIGGGGGGGGGAASAQAFGQGGGGGAGEVTELVGGSAVTVAPGETITINIGAGGAGGANQGNGTAGSATTVSFATASTITAAGGGGGGFGGVYGQGAGGTSGNGIAGNTTSSCLNGLMGNGNGGSGATGAGGTGLCGTSNGGGTAGAGFSSVILNDIVGVGGTGGGSLSSPTPPGAGQGGVGSMTTTNATGFAGGKGLVAVRYLTPAPSTPGAPVAVAGAGFATITVTPPSPNTGGPITSYTVTASSGGGSCTVQPPQTSCVISPLTPGTSYTFTATATSRPGATSSASTASNSITPTAASAPSAPTNVAVSGMTTTSQTVAWTASTGGPASYTAQAYSGGTAVSGATCSATPPTTTCTVNGLTAGNTYTYVVTATNSAGSTASAPSAPATIPTGAPAAPPAPVVLGGPFIEVSWVGYPYVTVLAPETPASDGVTSFTASVSSTGNSSGTPGHPQTCTITLPARWCIAPVLGYGFTSDGYPISVTITATNAVGTSAASPARTNISGGPYPVYSNGSPIPAAPTIATSAANGVATVTFTPGAPATADVGAYLVKAMSGSTLVAQCYAFVPETTCDLTGLVGGTTYNLERFSFASGGSGSGQALGIVPASVPAWVSTNSWNPGPPNPNPPAVNNTPIRGMPSVAVATTAFTMPIAPPGVPGTPVAVAGSGQATVTFTPPTSGGTPVSYTATSSPGGYTCTVAATANPLQCTVTGLTNGTAYTFTTTATNTAGTSAPSAATQWSVTPFSPNGAPGTPGALTAAVVTTTSASVTVAAPASGAVTSYTVTSSPGGQTCTISSPFPNPLACTVSSLTAGGTYTFTAVATNVAGASNSTTSSNSVTLAAPSVPAAPVAVAGNGSAVVTMPTPTGGTPTSYTVTASGGQTCTITTPDTSCTFTGLTNGTSYTFTATATNALGTSTASPASNAVVPSAGGGGGGGGGGSSSGGSGGGSPSGGGVPAPAPVPAGLQPGGASVVVGGHTVTPTVQPVNLAGGSRGNGIAVSGPGFQGTIIGPSVGGSVPASTLIVVAGQQAAVSASGYQPGATVVVLLMPAGTTVGSATANAQGVVTITANIPATAANGTAALQINGVGALSTQLAMSIGAQVVSGVAPVPLTSGVLPTLAPGKAANTAAGTLAPAKQSRASSGGLQITVDGAKMRVAGVDGAGTALPVPSDGALVVQDDMFVSVSGSGFKPGTYVGVWAFSEPLFVGLVLTSADGTYSAQLPLPEALPVGDHTLQANGTTKHGSAFSTSLGLRVLSAGQIGKSKGKVRKAEDTVFFAAMSSRVSADANTALKQLVKKVGKHPSGTLVVGFVQRSGSTTNDVALSRARATSVAAALRKHGLTGRITLRADGVFKHATTGAKARRVDVTVSYRK